MLNFLCAICASALGAVGCQQDQPTAVTAARLQQAAAAARDTTLAPSGDTYVERSDPSANYGTRRALLVGPGGERRALLRWDNAALAQAAAGGTVTAARLELTLLKGRRGEGERAERGDHGGTIALHRLTHSWTETGATWSCADEQHPVRGRAGCPKSANWVMGGPDSRQPWVSAPTATVRPDTARGGVVTFDVTADVLAWLSGTENDGWILTAAEGRREAAGEASFGSRESASGPRIVLTLASSGTWPILSGYPRLDASRLVHPPGDTAFLYFRVNLALRFREGVSDSAKRAFFARNSISVIGIGGGQFFVTIPDPGPSLDSLYAAVDRLRAQPEIFVVVLIEFTPMSPARFSRYPSDGPTEMRSDWFNGPSSTWAMRAIRSNLAWGCETGLYGSVAPVGIFEWKHALGHPEFARSSPVLREPSNPAMDTFPKVAPDTIAADIAHAIATTGLLTAEGDNGSGIAGVNWATRLFMYAGLTRANQRVPLSSGFYILAPPMVSDGIRVLSISVDARYRRDSRPEDRRDDILNLKTAVQDELLDKLPSLLVVVAAGNERRRYSAADYYKDSLVAPLRAALLLLRTDPKYRDRIIFVAGTEPGNRFWDTWAANPSQGSNFFSNATDIAAPAQDVSVLGPWHGETGLSVPIAVATGTSVAAPLVAGVAAQLLAMDTTLRPQDIKDYIVRGAKEGRTDPATGALVEPANVQGAPETVYQLDAYGALTLLSRERPGTPICGFSADLAAPDALSPFSNSVLLRRPRGPGETLAVPGAGTQFDMQGVSIAQGGRMIALHVGEASGMGTHFIDQAGRIVASPLPGLQRHFLERDTVDYDWSAPGHPMLVFRRGGEAERIDVVGLVVGADEILGDAEVAVSPSDEFAAVDAMTEIQDQCGTGARLRHFVVNLSTKVGTVVDDVTLSNCTPFHNEFRLDMVWAQDSRSVTFLKYFSDDEGSLQGTVVTRWSVKAGVVPPVRVNDIILAGATISADGALLSAQQWDVPSQQCGFVWLVAGAPSRRVTDPLPLPYDEFRCIFARGTRSEVNLRASSVRDAAPPAMVPWRPQRDSHSLIRLSGPRARH